MAEIRGIVTKVQGERCEVKVDKTESELKNLPKYLDCWNPINAKPGNIVGAEYRDGVVGDGASDQFQYHLYHGYETEALGDSGPGCLWVCVCVYYCFVCFS